MKVTDSVERSTLTVPEAAIRLGISKNHAYSLAAAGWIPTLRLGRRLVVPVAAFEAMLASTDHARTQD